MLQAVCHQLLVTLLLPYHGWVAMMLALRLVQHPRMILMAKATSASEVGQKRMYYRPKPLLSYRQMSSRFSNDSLHNKFNDPVEGQQHEQCRSAVNVVSHSAMPTTFLATSAA